jgi:prevent-host-death family protein
MQTFTVAEAKAQLSRLIAIVEAGEEVTITKRGKVVARIVQHPSQRQKMQSMAALRATMPFQTEPAGEFIRRLRDTDRY